MIRSLRGPGVLAAVVSIGGIFAGSANASARCPAPQQHGQTITADVAVIGADSGGTAAAIAAARKCVSVVLVSAVKTPGGMLTAGQIGFVDGDPIFYWANHPGAGHPDGQIVLQSSWALSGGLWREFRQRINPKIQDTLRYQPRAGAAAMEAMVHQEPNLLLLTDTYPTAVKRSGRRIANVTVAGSFSRTIKAHYWVDGSDTGDLIGLAHLPYQFGDKNGDIRDYAYRWTAIRGNSSLAPSSPPPYYTENLPYYNGCTASLWPLYQKEFGIAPGSSVTVNPFRLEDNQGLLSNPPAVETWDVNGCFNDTSGGEIGNMLRDDAVVTTMFARYGLPNPFQSSDVAKWLHWAAIPWIDDSSPLSATDKRTMVGQIEDAAKDRSFGFLWYIRSGSLQSELRRRPGAANATVQSDWTIDNELGTPDGMPEEIYQREGRRIDAVYDIKTTDICPSFAKDQKTLICSTAPRYFEDGIAVGDYSMDVGAGTLDTKPYDFYQPRPFQVPFRALIPKNTTDLLVTSALGAQRIAYGALREDPLRFLIGEAVGDAVAEASADHVDNFTKLNIAQLRETLADNHHETFFVKYAPNWNGTRWVNDGVGVVIQKLFALGVLKPEWDFSPLEGSNVPAPADQLNGTMSQALMKLINQSRCCTEPIPWRNTHPGSVVLLSQLETPPGGHNRIATLQDAYDWLLNETVATS